MKIVSGGQTGADRGALDAAMEQHVETGGWCPQGRKAEDGVIPTSYTLVELPGGGYRERTLQNVIDSDGTVVIFFSAACGGTELTIRCCGNENRPVLLVDADDLTIARAAERVSEFVAQHSISVLNVAGPRASGEPRAYAYARSVINSLLKSLKQGTAENSSGTGVDDFQE